MNTLPDINDINGYSAEQPPARIVAGALAHLATHMSTGCPRAAWLAAMLLERVANDPDADAHLRDHARELVDILEQDRPSPAVPALAVNGGRAGDARIGGH